MPSFGRHFDCHEVIIDVQPCNIDNRWRSVIFKNNGRFKDVRKLILSNLMTDLWSVIYKATDHCKRETISKINTIYIHTLCMRAAKALVRLLLFAGLSEPQLLTCDKKYVLIQLISI